MSAHPDGSRRTLSCPRCGHELFAVHTPSILESDSSSEMAVEPSGGDYVDLLRRVLKAIAIQESGEDYHALGRSITSEKSIHYSQRAIGKYQLMPVTVCGLVTDEYPEELLDAVRDLDYQRIEELLLAHHDWQEQLAFDLAYELYKAFGPNPYLIAAGWYAGESRVKRMLESGELDDSPVMTTGEKHPSVREYATRVYGRYRTIVQKERA